MINKSLVYIANLRLPTEKAYGVQIAKMCEAFADLGLDITLVVPYRINKIRDEFFSFYSLKKNFKFKKIFLLDFYLPGKLNILALSLKNLVSAIGLGIYALTKNVDIIYSRDELSLFFLSFFKKNLVYETHRFSNARKFIYKRFINKNLKIVAITYKLKEDLVKIGFEPDNILVAPDGVDLGKFDLPISQKEAREKLDLPFDKKIIMYTGHLFEWKGAGTLLEAARNTKDILFVFVGGTDYDVEKFRGKAKELDNVLILGYKPYSQIPVYLKAADVLVLPNSAKEDISSKYTSPLKLFEYMASSRPIVASNLPSIVEILNKENAMLISSDDSVSIINGIKFILDIDNAEYGERISRKAREDVENYTWEKRTISILHFLELVWNEIKIEI